MELYADIIIDISHSRLDQTFQYRVPEEMAETIEPGNVVEVPFGRGERKEKGYVLRLSEQAVLAPEKIKTILHVETDFAGADSKLTALALWMRDYYGSSTVQALRTVLPFRQKTSPKKKKRIVLLASKTEAMEQLELCRKKHQSARVRLLEALIDQPVLPQELVTGTLKVTAAAWKPLEEQKILCCESEQIYRMPLVLQQLREATQVSGTESVTGEADFCYTKEQQAVIDEICGDESGPKKEGRYLIHGVTGSGKTAVYMELIADTLKRGQQAILLIPEIALTYQNVIRFYRRFGDRISILHSRLTPAERYDQFERAKTGEIDVMIGPRSALFTPFGNLGMIIMDEEHESSYNSEAVPRYHTRDVAKKRAALEHAKLVLGSATPSLEAYYGAMHGEYQLVELKQRATGGTLPGVQIADMRKELREGNRSILSRMLYEKMQSCLADGKQMMLFLNRRGYSGFVSCRSCGQVLKCPHCDVSLTLHRNGRMVCHYCGYEEPAVKKCPDCGSPFIGGFRAGTQQIEELIQHTFPQARVLRMDADTTRGKDGHAEILRAFGRQEADILIGTQMIVKGHDFPGVTLVGILAADLSLNVSDYRAAERTFQLLTQAAGRAGRGNDPGEVVVQTYDPEHYAIQCAVSQEYLPFYEQELQYRELSGYPPAGEMMAIHCDGAELEKLEIAAEYLVRFIRMVSKRYGVSVMGPVDETVSKIKDVYRKVIYLKHADTKVLIRVKNSTEQYVELNEGFREIRVQFERP